MSNVLTLNPVAYIRTDFPGKFGVPRQSGLTQGLPCRIEFVPPYRTPDALRGIDGYSHLWLLWGFSQNEKTSFSPVVRPPRLGGNKKMGVFATRSPYRPNPIGLTLVKFLHVGADGALIVSGADMADLTPIYDIKPYLPAIESIPNAKGGFAAEHLSDALKVCFPPALLSLLPEQKHAAILDILSQDPRPAYQQDPKRTYGFPFSGYDIRFQVDGDMLTVTALIPL